ncbi:HNH endonuclease signature motif containing protein [Cellulomonas carbonis]|uniref:DUF222 domain-containing protein n=1 Tax=Cellulomonas carbonis T26 TaxID=947969 RepID=A0A0A0BNY3_9CELL|nr:HNH endonuclease signature motif containing protein [Cellulomonas carbonis]KGM08759.1 hypothetical protein N868_06390 [Cellulomonas carbonis T26]GGB99369.1 hypothetical protein GCM10010972_10250 [Cellulomonas carbonis]
MFDRGPELAGGGSALPPGARRAVPPPDDALADLLAAAPSPGLAHALTSLDPTRLDEVGLTGAVAAWDRMASWVAAQQARVVLELARRERPRLAPDSYVADMIGCEMSVTRRAAQVLVDRAWALDAAPAVADAMMRGEVAVAKADAILRGTEHLPAELAAVVQATVLPDAAHRTVPQLRDALRRAELACAPDLAAGRHERARAERGVWLRPSTDAMAWVNALLPAADAMRVMTAVDALATSCGPDDDRPADARRADALTDLATTVLDRGTDLTGAPLPVHQGRRPHLQVTVTLAALCGDTDTSAELAGYGPVPASVARAIAAEASWTFLAVDARSGQVVDRSASSYRPSAAVTRAVVDRDVTCTFPGCRVPAPRCDLDHTVPFDPRRPAADQTTTANLAALCRHHHRLKTHARWTPVHDRTTGTTTWTTPDGVTYSRDPVPVPFEQHPLPQPSRRPTQDARDALDDRDDREATGAESSWRGAAVRIAMIRPATPRRAPAPGGPPPTDEDPPPF